MDMYNVRLTEIFLATNLFRAYCSRINQMSALTRLLGEEVEADGTVIAAFFAYRKRGLGIP